MKWHDTEDFWKTWGPILFSEKRIDAAREQVEKIIELLKIKRNHHVLDLCCGVGRHTLEFARRGYRVTGVDRTERYLRTARKNTKNENLNIGFVKCDMRRYRKPDTYDIAINYFTSFGYFDNPKDDIKVLKNIFLSLRQNGKLLIDIMGKEILARIFKPSGWYRFGKNAIILEERFVRDDWSWMENHWILIKKGKKKEFTVTHRIYSAKELKDLFGQAGFGRVKAFGHLDGSPYDHESKRLIVVGQKVH